MKAIGSVPLLIFAAVVTGCAVTGPITPLESSQSGFDGAVYAGQTTVINAKTQTSEQYRVFNQAATGFVPNSANIADAESRAKTYCNDKGKQLRVLSLTTSPAALLPGNFPRAELVFECVNGVTQETKYDQLLKLKSLLDNNAISEAEFADEKRKILNSE
ncbi:hypothetical protein dqs_1784 [Azoarcus olearius]|uniref:SHOCT domain-containing protein n=1 Tax=Azoarcus sp. (strain BH72) TaxID=418699 RepID=UPI000806362E|nr:SHOCT domain-containing protein [Azoarcus olearius]ANQ84822.1 hypothetical protein dqs_1784 [Azoarcus olearius]